MHPILAFRLVLASALLALPCLFSPGAAAAVDGSYSGSWYNPPESGSGFNLEVFSSERALLYWYTYDDAGEPVWLYSEGELSGNRIDFAVYYSDGMRFSDLDTADKANRRWGSATMTFSDCSNATLSYSSTLTGLEHSPVGTRTLPLQRLISIHGHPCREAASGYYTGRHFDPTLNGGKGAWADLSGVLAPDGEVYLRSAASGKVFIGTYGAGGTSAALTMKVCADRTDDCFAATGSATYKSRYFLRGTFKASDWGTQSFELVYHPLYDQQAVTADVAGNYTMSEGGVTYTVSIDGNGTLTGSDTRGCFYDGYIYPYDVLSHSGAYEYQGLLQGCLGDEWDTEEWTGVVMNIDEWTGDRRLLLFILDTGDGAVSFVLRR